MNYINNSNVSIYDVELFIKENNELLINGIVTNFNKNQIEEPGAFIANAEKVENQFYKDSGYKNILKHQDIKWPYCEDKNIRYKYNFDTKQYYISSEENCPTGDDISEVLDENILINKVDDKYIIKLDRIYFDFVGLATYKHLGSLKHKSFTEYENYDIFEIREKIKEYYLNNMSEYEDATKCEYTIIKNDDETYKLQSYIIK